MSLASLTSKKSISSAALSSVLADLSETGLPSAISRRSIKRARESKVDIETPFGQLIVSKTIQLPPTYKKGKKGTRIIAKAKKVDLPFVNPLALLYHVCSTYEAYANLMKKCLSEFDCCAASPLDVVCYADEVSCGNVLRHSNGRKLQVWRVQIDVVWVSLV